MNNTNGGYKILIVDDEPDVLAFVKETLTIKGYICKTALNSKEALRKLRSDAFHLLITDIRLPDGSGINIIKIAREKHPYMAAIVITGFASIEGVKEAMDLGVMDYLPKPFSVQDLLLSVESVIKKQKLRRHSSGKSLIFKSAAMEKVLNLVKKVGKTESTVLLTGESGTGKEMIARSLHRISRRAGGPFISVNSGGIPENLLESELFGHIKGSYTGASSTTLGHFQSAEGGTLFLDEIGNMSQQMQIKLLRALQEREVTPVGSTTPVPVSARLISATNSNLRKDVEEGTFRQDLFYRLNIFEIKIPPLRERTDDIIPLAEHFLSTIQGPTGKCLLHESVITCLLSYSWPGNVRELENVMERAIILAGNDYITAEHLPEWISGTTKYADLSNSDRSHIKLDTIVAAIEKHYIVQALQTFKGVKSKAATHLGLKRTTLLARMKKLGITEGSERDIHD